MKLRAAVVGVGYLGRFHAQKYKNNPAVELVAVCDGRAEQAQAVAAELGCEAVTDPASLIGRVDLVTVAASTQAHYALGKLFLEAGVPLNLEKPLAATAAQARELVELAARQGVVLSTGHIERFNPSIVALKEQMKAPRFIDLIRHTGFRARGADVSVMHDLMIHDIDLLHWLTGSRVKDLRASGVKVIAKTWDAVEVFATMENGMQARLSASRVSSRPQRAIRVLENGRALQADTGILEVDLIEPVAFDAAEPLKISKVAPAKVDALQLETDAFVASVREKRAPVITGADGLAALEVVERLEKLLEENR